MASALPLRANLEWLKKTCKERLALLRASDPSARLSDAQLAIAREYGFPSWRKLKAHVDQLRDRLNELIPGGPARPADAAAVSPDDPELGQLLSAVTAGDATMVAQWIGRRVALAAARGPDGQTPLHVAAQCDDPRLGVYLLAHGADPEARFGESGHTALSWAVTCGSMSFAETLLRVGAKADLFCAAGMGAVDLVRGFFDDTGTLRPGASVTGSSRYAADGSRLPCPPPSPRDQISDAFCFACRNGQAEVVRELLAKQPDLSFRGFMGGTALHWAYFGGSREVIELVTRAGADPNARDLALGCTPRAFGICAPASWGFLRLVRERLEQDPSLAKLMDGRTSALHEAARAGHPGIVRLLLDHGANPMLRDGEGRTPADLATERGHAGVVEVLRSTGP